eukprot:991061-Amphidinium_carterae.2
MDAQVEENASHEFSRVPGHSVRVLTTIMSLRERSWPHSSPMTSNSVILYMSQSTPKNKYNSIADGILSMRDHARMHVQVLGHDLAQGVIRVHIPGHAHGHGFDRA